jgi:putative holliday junction resolvase
VRYLSIDLGLKRIGIAISMSAGIVTPLKAIERKNRNQASDEVKALIKEWQIDRVVVGIPMGGSSEDEMRRRAEHFMKLVDFNGKVFFQDESDSSLEAEDLIKGEMSYKKDGRIDSLAAKVILERWLSKKNEI